MDATIEQRVARMEQFLRDNYLYEQPAEADEATDGVPQPCSWCGSHQSVCDKAAPGEWQVYCNACEYGTRLYTTPEAAWRAWNAGEVTALVED